MKSYCLNAHNAANPPERAGSHCNGDKLEKISFEYSQIILDPFDDRHRWGQRMGLVTSRARGLLLCLNCRNENSYEWERVQNPLKKQRFSQFWQKRGQQVWRWHVGWLCVARLVLEEGIALFHMSRKRSGRSNKTYTSNRKCEDSNLTFEDIQAHLKSQMKPLERFHWTKLASVRVVFSISIRVSQHSQQWGVIEMTSAVISLKCLRAIGNFA